MLPIAIYSIYCSSFSCAKYNLFNSGPFDAGLLCRWKGIALYEGNREIVQCNYNFKHGKKIYVDNTLKGNAMDFPVWCYGNYAKTSSKQSKKSPGELYTCNSCNCIHVIVIVNSACVIRLCFVNCI